MRGRASRAVSSGSPEAWRLPSGETSAVNHLRAGSLSALSRSRRMRDSEEGEGSGAAASLKRPTAARSASPDEECGFRLLDLGRPAERSYGASGSGVGNPPGCRGGTPAVKNGSPRARSENPVCKSPFAEGVWRWRPDLNRQMMFFGFVGDGNNLSALPCSAGRTLTPSRFRRRVTAPASDVPGPARSRSGCPCRAPSRHPYDRPCAPPPCARWPARCPRRRTRLAPGGARRA